MEKENKNKKDKPNVIICILLGILFLCLGIYIGIFFINSKHHSHHGNAPCNQAFDCECEPNADYCLCKECEDDTCFKTHKIKCYFNHNTTTKGD